VISILKKSIKLYRLLISPWLGTRCRFAPTCSDYAMQALDKHGLMRGTALSAKRLCRCHPFGGHGYDPVPDSTINQIDEVVNN